MLIRIHAEELTGRLLRGAVAGNSGTPSGYLRRDALGTFVPGIRSFGLRSSPVDRGTLDPWERSSSESMARLEPQLP